MASNTSRQNKTSKPSAASKRTSAGKSKNSSAKSSALRDEIIVLCIIAFAIILLLSNFGFAGSIGDSIKRFMFGMFGIIEYILPILMAGSILFIMANKHMGAAKIKTAAVSVLMLLLCAVVQLAASTPQTSERLTAFFQYSSQEKLGGGLMGGLLSKALSPLGTGGSYVLLCIFIIICIIIITEKSFIGGIKNNSIKAYHYAKEDIADYKEHKRIRQEEKEERQKRTDKKVRGVALDTVIPKEISEKGMDIHEITADFTREDKYSKDIYNPDETTYQAKEPAAGTESFRNRKRNHHKKYTEITNEANNENQEEFFAPDKDIKEGFGGGEKNGFHSRKEYTFPPMHLLNKNASKASTNQDKANRETALRLQQTLQNFGVKVIITDISCGPSVTRFELQPEQGVKVSKIVSLTDDIKLNLAAADIRIEAPIPGKAAVGIEVPNKEIKGVVLRELLESDMFRKCPSAIAFVAGRDISGQIVIADIARMPHLLIAGATGSGKSVCINTIIMSILYKAHPDDVKMVMIDPKVVELSVYNGIPHLMIPVVTDPKKAAGALNWAVAEMTKRYKLFADVNVRDLKGYNEKIGSGKETAIDPKPEKMPQIVIIIDELADLMMVAPSEVEDAICRLAQLARAAGIHLVIATQRPSVNVITGLIKANVPSRIAFSVSSGVDSRTILDMNGAEKLLGKGDMLFYPSGYQKPVRVQGAFVTDQEVGSVVKFLKTNISEALYSEEITNQIENVSFADSQAFGNERDAYFADAGRFIIEKEKGSIGMIQRYYKVGFNRAARIMDQLADAGVVGPEEGTKPRKILMTMEEFEEYIK